ncbi:MAG: hypothetical protein SFU56_09025 [Capsulimonadales bacterium]|nr:hypothetical protein [Capsulimonadales bacterium]
MGCQPQRSDEKPYPATRTISESAANTLQTLRNRFPHTPFLALGQTALWDEPTKASLLNVLRRVWPGARMMAAVHDTDYFAKLPGHRSPEGHKFALVTHDDFRTRGLWSAAGEMSRLFGSEDVPTQHLLARQGGVSLHRALSHSDDPAALLSELTAAWGWTGIVYTEWDRKIARDIPLAEILSTLLEQIADALRGSVECLDETRSRAAMTVGGQIGNWVTDFAESHPDASLTDLYRDLLPRFYGLLLGGETPDLATSSTFEILRFNSATAALPRFGLVDLFLHPNTRQHAIDSYNLAVAGSDIYTLDQFGEGAIPFDLVLPGRGRGTIRLPGDGTILVDTPREPIVLCDRHCDIDSVGSLARLVERELGPDVALVGKAVTLLPLLGAEHILVFHESASGYSGRTWKMCDLMRERGLSVPEMHPILRIRYATWDSLQAVSADNSGTFVLPEHLTQALGRDRIDFADFAFCWRNAVAWEKQRLAGFALLKSPRALLAALSRQFPATWTKPCDAYEDAAAVLLDVRRQADEIRVLEKAKKARWQEVVDEAFALEQAKGDHFRANLMGRTLSETERAQRDRERRIRFDRPIAELREEAAELRREIRQLYRERKALEKGEVASEARTTMNRIAAEAEREKARQVRNALQTVNGLPHTNFRPSAWWFPLVDPTGAWFQGVAATAVYYLEGLSESA